MSLDQFSLLFSGIRLISQVASDIDTLAQAFRDVGNDRVADKLDSHVKRLVQARSYVAGSDPDRRLSPTLPKSHCSCCGMNTYTPGEGCAVCDAGCEE